MRRYSQVARRNRSHDGRVNQMVETVRSRSVCARTSDKMSIRASSTVIEGPEPRRSVSAASDRDVLDVRDVPAQAGMTPQGGKGE